MISFLLIILEQLLLHIPLVIGAYISFSLMKVADLSIESAYITGAMIGAKALLMAESSGVNSLLILPIALVASCFGGALVGLVSSGLTRLINISHLLSSIVTFGLFYGFAHYIGGAYLSLSGHFNPLLFGVVPRHPELITLLIINILLCSGMYLFLRTQIGYSLVVYGINKDFFKHYGISGSAVFVIGIATSNMLAGLSGYLFAQSNGFVEINMAFGKVLFCLSALILGKIYATDKNPVSLFYPIIGAISYFVLQQLLLKGGFNLKYFTAVQALVILLVLECARRLRNVSASHWLGI
jgi:putative tryptophan/tyrosine transport system permease protein